MPKETDSAVANSWCLNTGLRHGTITTEAGLSNHSCSTSPPSKVRRAVHLCACKSKMSTPLQAFAAAVSPFEVTADTTSVALAATTPVKLIACPAAIEVDSPSCSAAPLKAANCARKLLLPPSEPTKTKRRINQGPQQHCQPQQRERALIHLRDRRLPAPKNAAALALAFG